MDNPRSLQDLDFFTRSFVGESSGLSLIGNNSKYSQAFLRVARSFPDFASLNPGYS